jgi:hypothetical protein
VVRTVNSSSTPTGEQLPRKASCGEDCEQFIHNYRRAAADERHLVVRTVNSSSTTTGEQLLMKGILW